MTFTPFYPSDANMARVGIQELCA